MLFTEIIAICYVDCKEHINTVCRQNAELLDGEAVGTCSNHWAS
jgi:hypothetical protein